jgi:outer membrane protein assembly factor BamE (lipoprotein component of BamABCDE complex)
MLTFGLDQILQRSEQVLNESQFARISAGLSRDQVRRLLGKPGQVNVYRNSGEEVWDWRFAGGLPTEEWHFHVHFDQESGLVKRSSRRLEQRG